MKNKLITALAVITMTATAVSAAEPAFELIVAEDGGYNFRISGTTESKKAGNRINVMIFNPGMDFANAGNSEALQYQNEIITGEGGSFFEDIPVYFDGKNDTGWYKLYLSGDDFDEAIDTLKVYAASDEDIKMVVAELDKMTSSADIKKLLENEDKANTLSLSGMGFEELDKGQLAELILLNAKDEAFIDENDKITTIRNLKQLIILENYNQGNVNNIISEDKLLNTDYIDLSEIDKDGITLYNVYEDIVKDKTAFVKALCNKNYTTAEDLKKSFLEQAFINGISDAKTSGSGHIKDVLTLKNAQAVSVDISNYLSQSENNKNKMASVLVKNKYTTLEDIENYITNYKPETTGGGSTSDSSGGISSLPVVGTQTNPEDKPQNDFTFTDLDGYQWAEEAIIELYNSGVINGVGDNKFAPENKVTREQFVVMLMRALRVNESSDECEFSDVVNGSYYAGYVQAVKKAGIVNGIDENNFGVGLPIKRQDIAVITKNTLTYLKLDLNKVRDIQFADTVDEYAVEAVDFLTGTGIINGFTDNTFRGSESCTRAQAAKIIYELLKRI